MTTENKNQISYGTPLIAWQAPEFLEHKRGPVWVFVMSVLVVGLILYGILTDSIAFSVVVVLLAVVFFLTYNHKPEIVDIVITDAGIKFGPRFYPYEDIGLFWIIYDPPHVKTLNLRITRGVVRQIAIQLGDQNPAEVRALLSQEVSEWKNRTETFSEILIRLFKL